MIVSNNTLLNILLPKDNATLKEALKEADVKSLTNNKGVNVQDILKNLVDGIKGKTQSNEAVLNMLKNSSVFKNLGSFPQQLNTLLQNLPNDAKFDNLKALLQSFLTNIQDVDENNLKDLIQKSGIFLESKLAKGGVSQNATQLNNILMQIKELIKNDASPQAKQLNLLIDKIIAQNQPPQSSQAAQSPAQLNGDIKSALSLLKVISSNTQNPNATKIAQLTQQLEGLKDNAKLVESKIQNIQPNISKEQVVNTQLNTQRATLTSQQVTPQTTAQPSTTVQQETKITPSNLKIEQSSINSDAKNLLNNLKTELLNSKNPIFTPIIKQIDNLLQTQDLFSKNQTLQEPKALLSNLIESPQLKQASAQQPQINSTISDLKGSIENISKLESSILQNKVSAAKIEEVVSQLKQNLTTLQNQLSEIKNLDVKGLNQLIDRLLNLSNLFSKIDIPTPLQQLLGNTNSLLGGKDSVFTSNFSNNMSSLIVSLKSALAQTNPNQSNQQFEMFKNVAKLESFLNTSLTQLQNNPNAQTITSNDLHTDIKSLLLQAQGELAKNGQSAQELSKQIDKLIGHIEYYQLLSATSSSNFVYIPFLWDMMEDGSISMKKTDEERYFCEIHLTLKELGNMDLMLSLYDKNSLDISVFSNTDFAKEMIRDNLTALKQGLNKIDIIPRNIKILDLKEETEVEKQPTNIYAKNNTIDDISYGVDIKV